MPRIFAAVMMAFMLALIAAPARSFETATADDTARFLAGLPLSSNSPLAPYTKDPPGSSMPAISIRFLPTK